MIYYENNTGKSIKPGDSSMELSVVQDTICAAIRAIRQLDSHKWCRDTYHKYKETVGAFEFYKALSAQLSSCSLNVLDVGAGELMTARMLCPLGNSNINTYTAVDHKDCPDEHTQNMTKRALNFQVVPTDYRKLIGLPVDFYDVVIIDIEPHGATMRIYWKYSLYCQKLIYLPYRNSRTYRTIRWYHV